MNKISVSPQVFAGPMPMAVVGCDVQGKANFITIAWISRVNYQPPLIGFASGKRHYTNQGISEHKVFSVNIPGQDLIRQVDYCGLVSGEKFDKSKVFTLFYGQLPHAPMISECPLTMECRLLTSVELPTNNFIIGEIVAAYSEEKYVTNGSPDIAKMNPFILTMPDNSYWGIGDKITKAWEAGKELMK
jgi:flavin reductase (DIM6/NTAB) family NADH-FMN oxidoreductase RutF